MGGMVWNPIIASRWTILASRQVSLLAVCFLMKLNEIVRGKMDGDYSV